MKYTPARTDIRYRAIYCILLIASIICFFIKPNGILYTVLQSLGLLLITASLAMFIRYESITYSYLLIEKNGHFDFYVDRTYGRRGSYVCYFPLRDTVKIVKKTDSTRAELRKEFKNIYFYNYGKNAFCGEKYIIVFANGERYDAIIFEPDSNFVSLIEEDLLRIEKEKAESEEY